MLRDNMRLIFQQVDCQAPRELPEQYKNLIDKERLFAEFSTKAVMRAALLQRTSVLRFLFKLGTVYLASETMFTASSNFYRLLAQTHVDIF